MSKKRLLVSKIENGIVVDHIPAGRAFLVLKLLKPHSEDRVLIAQNAKSTKHGKKDLIKLGGRFLTTKQMDLISLVAPTATINIIKNWKVERKIRTELPEYIESVFRCPNTTCTTNEEYPSPQSKFRVLGGERTEDTRLQCVYCGSNLYYGTIIDNIDRDKFTIDGEGVVSKKKVKRVFLNTLLESEALRIAPSPKKLFTLKSGRQAPYFINLGALTEGKFLGKLKWSFASFIKLLLEEEKIEDFDYIYGPAYKGISLAALACEGLNELFKMNKKYIYDRKEMKEYGDWTADQIIVGAKGFEHGERVLIVDDTITTGKTKEDSLKKLDLLGDHEVVGLVLAADRQEKVKGREIEEKTAVEYLNDKHDLKAYSIQNIKTIYNEVKENLSEEMERAWNEYFKKYVKL